MITQVLFTFFNLFVFVFNIVLLARVVGSYVASPENRLYQGLVNMTEPVLAPVRRLLPQTPGLDLAPLVTFFLLQLAQHFVGQWFGV